MSVSITFTIGGVQEDAEALKEIIRKKSMAEGLSMSEWIVQAIAEYLRKGQHEQIG